LTPRQELGRRLLELRQKAGLTGAALAKRLGTTQPRVSRIETGRTVPNLDDVRTWADATNATPEEVAELGGLVHRLATEATSWRILHQLGLSHRQREIAELERQAAAILVFQPTMIPGLLQIADYARRVMSQGNPSSQPDLAQAVAERLERQTILYDQGKQFEFLLTEAALRWRPGPPELMRAQLDRVISVASLPNVSLGVLPFDIESPDAYLHPFVVFELGEDTFVNVETYSAGIQVHDPQEVEVYRRTLDRFRAAAKWADSAVREIQTIMPHPPAPGHLH